MARNKHEDQNMVEVEQSENDDVELVMVEYEQELSKIDQTRNAIQEKLDGVLGIINKKKAEQELAKREEEAKARIFAENEGKVLDLERMMKEYFNVENLDYLDPELTKRLFGLLIHLLSKNHLIDAREFKWFMDSYKMVRKNK